MGFLLIAAAFAAGPENGDFETGLAPWVDESTQLGAIAFAAQEGDDFGDYSDTTNLNFPSGTGAMVLKGGDGSIFSPAAAGSGGFVLTWDALAFRHRSENSQVAHELRLRDGGLIVDVFNFGVDPNGAFDSEEWDVTNWCGADATLQFLQYNTTQLFHYYTAIDNVQVAGSPCPDYVDGDLDGFCAHGTDLDADGLCDGPLEAEPASNPELDCDDTNGDRFPGNTEIVNDGVDQDCDGIDPTGECFSDDDGDGFGDTIITGGSPACDQLGETLVSGDCDDADPNAFPGATETPADGVDSDCDGGELCYADTDNDGFGGAAVPGSFTCDQPGETDNSSDCDDTRPEAFPGAPELCNGEDDDCDGLVDPNAAASAWPDDDGDSYGDGTLDPVEVCGSVAGFVSNDADCDDSDATVNPDATEIPADGVDSDCTGDELCYVDLDDDGFGAMATTAGPTDCGETGVADNDADCDDTTATVNPGRPEVCNGEDDDCDGVPDNGTGNTTYYEDLDSDGFGSTAVDACQPPGPEWVLFGGDCNEADALINPDGVEAVADGVDSDCDGGELCFTDADNDTFGVDTPTDSVDLDCTDPGESDSTDDCDDAAPGVNPDATEIAGNGIDEDCDGVDGTPVEDTGDTAVVGPPDEVIYRGGTACTVGTGGAATWGLLFAPFVLLRRRAT